jgi:AAA15 family ATPase/GTPase
MLKKIELTNFKSFRKATIHFGSLTVIVGANASAQHPFVSEQPAW